MRSLLLLSFTALTLFVTTATSALAEGTILTVTGQIEKTNREAFDPFFDGFLKFHDKTFEKAYTFDWDALASLPQKSITVNADTEDWPHPLKMEGPLLKDVLAAAGPSGDKTTLYALDGFGLEMSAEKMASREWILAMKIDGEPLGIGGFGPLWLVYDTGGRKAPEEEERSWVWSVFHIDIK
ncbi:hypothetical protein ACFPOD_02770 [Nitratireductor kimnyeongensis]|uniref:Molybdopterin-dependent oxidoreductase n=1 Tax=Nitratireductor kimnyeongensis TaxID=430679 RepID=A0ABW0T535_9HYPH|nr:hypothetical protein [Nitratireductor kimnyeongensis]QZZ34965.1 hypothetical protein KW403_14420 [Nitratireductor kimnyeongensis]